MSSNDPKIWFEDLWPDEFVLAGGRIGTRVYPSLVFRRVKDCPSPQCYVAPFDTQNLGKTVPNLFRQNGGSNEPT